MSDKNISIGRNHNIRRGDIFYVYPGKVNPVGSEYKIDPNTGRPAVVVSNDTSNHFSPCVEVVYMTTQPKTDLPTHVEVMGKVPSTALCESVSTVSKERLENYIRSISVDEMNAIDDALRVSLALTSPEVTNAAAEPGNISHEMESELIKVKAERNLYKELYESMLAKMIA